MSNTKRATCWSGTQFNLKAFEVQQNEATQLGWTVKGQLEECPETKRQHYQFAVKTPQVRMSQVRKVFPGAHIEEARNPKALMQYVNKEETRIGDLPAVSEMYPSLAKLWEIMFNYMIKEKYFIVEDGKISANFRRPWNKCVSLEWFDEFISLSIQDGYHIETMAVNPQTRSCWKLYAYSIVVRQLTLFRKSLEDRQTDRQVEFSSQQEDITNASAEQDDEGTSGSDSEEPTASDYGSGDDYEEDVSEGSGSDRSSEGCDSESDSGI